MQGKKKRPEEMLNMFMNLNFDNANAENQDKFTNEIETCSAQLAKLFRVTYDSFIKEGFNDEESFCITMEIVRSIVINSVRGQ